MTLKFPSSSLRRRSRVPRVSLGTQAYVAGRARWRSDVRQLEREAFEQRLAKGGETTISRVRHS